MDDERAGILQVGELPVVIRRESSREWDHSQALRSGAETAYGTTLAYVLGRRAAAGPYDDTRPWDEMATFLRDRIKENADGAAT